jgi:hypothetical protein
MNDIHIVELYTRHANMLESGFTEFKLAFAGTKNLAIGDVVRSDDFSAGGHVWRVYCYPHGDEEGNNGVYLSLSTARQRLQERQGHFFYKSTEEERIPHLAIFIHSLVSQGLINQGTFGFAQGA